MANAEVRGAREVQKKLTQVVRDIEGRPVLNAMRKATLLVQRSARKNAPVNTGLLRASIVPYVGRADPVIGIVGSNKTYAAPMELGTRPFFPPIAPLVRWVHLKGLAGTYSIKTKRRLGGKAAQAAQDLHVAYAIARAISKRGIRARRFLQRAFQENTPRVVRLLGQAVGEIVRKAR